jgi:hypothetical protein
MMATANMRERLVSKLDELNEEQIASLLSYVEAMQETALPDSYDEDNDPSIGFISGPSDLATRAKQILRDEITSLSGWTQKKD